MAMRLPARSATEWAVPGRAAQRKVEPAKPICRIDSAPVTSLQKRLARQRRRVPSRHPLQHARPHVRERPVVPEQPYGDLRFFGGIANGERVVKVPPADMNDGARIVIRDQQ